MSTVGFEGIPEDRVFEHTLKSKSFHHFSHYNYRAWTPPKVRRDWVSQWIAPGEYLDVGCGSYPVSMDMPDGYKRGVGVDISPEAGSRHKRYFKDFYLFDIEHINIREVPELRHRFGTVILSEALEHFNDPLKVLQNAKRFLCPGGHLLITYPNAYSIAQYMDRILHFGRLHRFKEFHTTHIYLVRRPELEKLFYKAGLMIRHFDFRSSDIVTGHPSEKNKLWRWITKLMPSFLGHQLFYVLAPRE